MDAAPIVPTVPAPKAIKLTRCHLALPLALPQTEQFRGAIAEQAGLQNELFHNHDNAKDGYHYRYPLVQYHSTNGNASLLGLGEGAEAMAQWMLAYDGWLRIGGKLLQAPIEEYRSRTELVQTTSEWHTYRIHDWVALNEKNYVEWRKTKRLVDQMLLLENAFVAHVMAFARGIDWFVDQRLTAELTDYHGCKWHKRRGAEMLAFDATFRIQAQLPEGIGLGKGVSIGFGKLKAKSEK